MKTRQDVEKLKQLWLDNPDAFDLAKTEGYEAYYDELTSFARRHTIEEEIPELGGVTDNLSHFTAGMALGLIPAMETQQDRIAMAIIRRLVKDAPEQLSGAVLEQYYQDIGYDAYQRASLILDGRTRFLKTNCQCPECRAKRNDKESQ